MGRVWRVDQGPAGHGSMALGRDARTGGARRTRYGVLSLSGIRRDQVVGRQSEEFRETRRFDQLAEEVGRVVVAAAVSGCFSQLCELLVEHRTAERRVDGSAVLAP